MSVGAVSVDHAEISGRGPLSPKFVESRGTRGGLNSPTLEHESPPECVCGCGEPVGRRENRVAWNRYAFQRCRQRVSDAKRFTSQPSPECACGCGLPARLNKRSGRPTLYAADKCRVRAFELNKRFGLVGDRPKICACGCGAPLEQTAKKPRKFATVQCRKRAWRDVHRPNRVRRPAKSSGDVVAAPDIKLLSKWARKSLGGCPRTRQIIVYEKLNLYKSIVYKQDFLKKFYSRTAS